MSDPSIRPFAGAPGSIFTTEEVEALMRIEFDRARRYRYPVACLAMQVDRLGEIHTIYGFDSKREILAQVVELVRKETRDGDLLGYVADDRLLLLLPHTAAQAVEALAGRLLVRVRQLAFQAEGSSLRITLSIGMSHDDQTQQLGFDTLLQVAHEGLAVADAAGGDRCVETELYDLVEGHQARGASGASGASGAPAAIPAAVDADPAYRARLEELVARDGDLPRAVSELVEEIMGRAVREAKQELAQASQGAPAVDPEREAGYRNEIDVLQRRIAKLTDSLGVTERELGRLRQIATADGGAESVYREVQGLDPEDARHELKRELMARIFEANLDLQRRQTG